MAAKPRPFRLDGERHEDDIHEAIVKAFTVLLLPSCEWTAMPGFGYCQLTGRQVAKLSRMGVHGGWPDFLLVHRGRAFGLEIKKPGEGRLSHTRMVRTKRGTL